MFQPNVLQALVLHLLGLHFIFHNCSNVFGWIEVWAVSWPNVITPKVDSALFKQLLCGFGSHGALSFRNTASPTTRKFSGSLKNGITRSLKIFSWKQLPSQLSPFSLIAHINFLAEKRTKIPMHVGCMLWCVGSTYWLLNHVSKPSFWWPFEWHIQNFPFFYQSCCEPLAKDYETPCT